MLVCGGFTIFTSFHPAYGMGSLGPFAEETTQKIILAHQTATAATEELIRIKDAMNLLMMSYEKISDKNIEKYL